MRFASSIRLVSLGVLLLFCASSQQAQTVRHPVVVRAPAARVLAEKILEFHSDITLDDDSSLLVTETIAVIANGGLIRHGIYRDFPTRYSDFYGNRYEVGFEVVSATRDEAVETFRVEDLSNGKRVYLGDPNTFVSRGQHTYTLTYRTTRQLGFLKDHDELFWNVTGLGWAFPITQTSATVHLPAAIPADKVNISGFTGPAGSRASELTATKDDSLYNFVTTKPLGPHEGLTILLQWPKGFVSPPTQSQNFAFFIHDNRDVLILAGGFLLLLIYYGIAWSAAGRDPEKGMIMPLYEPPADLSPAGMRYLARMGFDNKTFAAAILDMAARGYLKISQEHHTYRLTLTGKETQVLTPDEREVAATLFSDSTQVQLRQENHVVIRAALRALQKWLKAAENQVYFFTNWQYLIAPALLSVLIAFGYLWGLGKSRIGAGIFICVWLTGWSVGVYAILRNAVSAWHEVFYSRSSALEETLGVGKALFVTAFSLPFVAGEAFGFFFLLKVTSLSMVIFIAACGMLHVAFLHWMKAPTISGRRLMDQVEGFKMFLGEVHGDPLNRAMPPQQTPETFERFLPYALALDVEQDWAEKFSSVLAVAGTAAEGGASPGYIPSFYSGSSWNGFSGSSFASSFSSSFTGAISASSAAPGSGGGGGSGGSGGGGGGGGGGGW